MKEVDKAVCIYLGGENHEITAFTLLVQKDDWYNGKYSTKSTKGAG